MEWHLGETFANLFENVIWVKLACEFDTVDGGCWERERTEVFPCLQICLENTVGVFLVVNSSLRAERLAHTLICVFNCEISLIQSRLVASSVYVLTSANLIGSLDVFEPLPRNAIFASHVPQTLLKQVFHDDVTSEVL